MGTKLVAVATSKKQERLLASCDFPMSYMPIAVYLWDTKLGNEYTGRLSRALQTTVELRAMTQRAYDKKFSILARAEAEEREFRTFNECVGELKATLCGVFNSLRDTGRFETLKGDPIAFRSQILRLSR